MSKAIKIAARSLSVTTMVIQIYFFGSMISAQEKSVNQTSVQSIVSKKLQTTQGLSVRAIRISFSTPTPGSSHGVCQTNPMRRTAFDDELLRISGDIHLDVEVDEAFKEFHLDLELDLEFRKIRNVTIDKYLRQVTTFKAKQRELLLAAIKQELKQQRYQFATLTDEEILEKFTDEDLKQKIEREQLNFQDNLVSSSRITINKTFVSEKIGMETIKVPFEEVVYSSKLLPRNVYKVQFSEEVPHERLRVGMFYTAFAIDID